MHFRIHRAYEKPDAGDGIRILVGTAPITSPTSGALRRTMHLDRTTVFGTVGCDVAAKELFEQNRGS